MGAVTIYARRGRGTLPLSARRLAALRLAAVALACAVSSAAPSPAGAATPRWSAPAALSTCNAAGTPGVVFPSDSPSHATGPGAIVWAAGSGCPGGPGARLDAIKPGAAPAAPLPPRPGGAGPLAPLSAAAAPQGRIAIAGADPRRRGHALAIEGRAGGPFAVLGGAAGMAPGVALSSAYLGDLALLAPVRDALVLETQRWFGGPPGRPRQVLAPDPHPGALTVAMDFRSDALAAWTADGSVWVRAMPASGRVVAAQRLGPAGPGTQIAALLSDDNRAIVMWTTNRNGGSDTYFDQSATGPRFGAAQRIEHAPHPHGAPAPPGSPQLVRLSSESVMCAWSATSAGRWVVRTAPVDQRGLREVGTISDPERDLALSALAPGPRGEAVALLTATTTGIDGDPEPVSPELLAARGIDASPGRTIFAAPQLVAPAGAVSGATVGVEPGTDRAVAVWRGSGGAIEYSVYAPGQAG